MRTLILRAAGAAIILAAVLAVAAAQAGRAGRPAQTVRIYEGVSDKGEVQEALDDAVSRALRALPGADRMVRYRVREITGEQGGIRGANTVRVSIEVTGDEAARAATSGTGPGLEEQGEVIRKALETELRVVPESVAVTQSVTLDLIVRNRSADPVRIPLRTGQKYDFEVWRDNRLVWRWGNNRVFTQSLGANTIPGGEAVTYREVWNLRNNAGIRVSAGKYEVRGYFTSRLDGLKPVATRALTITGR